MLDISDDYVLIIPRDEADQHALTAALYASADPEAGEGVGLTTATRVLSFVVPRSLAAKVGRGASDAPAEQPDGGEKPSDEQDGDAAPDPPQADQTPSGTAGDADAEQGAASAASSTRAARGKTRSAASDAAGSSTQEG